jgi:colanic acid/amylovoran biosynthesis glycosyltransferase
MKVAMVVRHFPLLSETFVINQVVGLIDRGHEVDIYATDSLHPGEAMHPEVARHGLLGRARLLPAVPGGRLRSARAAIGAFGVRASSDPLAVARNSARIVGVLGSPSGRRRPLSRLRALSRWVLPMADRAPYDIIHCQFGTVADEGAALRRLGSPGARLIVTFRGFDISQHLRDRGEGVYDAIFAEADFFLVNCDFFRRRLIGLGCDPGRLEVLRSGLDCSSYRFEPRRPPADGRLRVAMVGRLVDKKGTEYAIRAAALLIGRGRDLELRVVGYGPLRDELERLIGELGVGDRVRLIGGKARPEIVDELHRAHLFIAPSVTSPRGDQDAPINVLKEAMATGLPVVSTRHGGIPELVEDGVSGFLVPERDAEALADRLDELIGRPDRWEEMGRAGRDRVERDYDLGRLNDRLAEVYREAMRPSGRLGPAVAGAAAAAVLSSGRPPAGRVET